MKGKMIISFFIAIFLLSLLPYSITEIVGATSISYPIGFEGVAGQQYSDSLITTKKSSGNYNISAVSKRSGTKSFMFSSTAVLPSTGFMNLTYSKVSYLTNFSSYFSVSAGAGGGTQYWYFYNESYQGHNISISNITYDHCMIAFYYDYASGRLYYINNVGVPAVIDLAITFTTYTSFYWRVLNDLGDIAYRYSTDAEVTGVSCSPISFVNGYRIDRIIVKNTVVISTASYIDDANITLSTSYTGVGGSGGCIDTSGIDYYSKNIEVMDGYIDISSPFIEFTSHSTLSITPEVFELWVGSALYEGDSDTSNYFLYINGLSAGNPICFYLLSGETYVLQWDLSSFSPISEEVLVFELAHTITFDGNNYWNIAVATANLMYGPPSPTVITYKNTGTNGVLDGTPIYYGSCWKIYYSAFGTPESEENTDFNVGISLIGFNNHPTYNIPYSYIYETVFFEVFSNRTDNYYYVNISKQGVATGGEQGFPKTVYAYHTIYGFTPTTSRNYTVNLCKKSNNLIVKHLHFNITVKTVDYAIWTFPNPSNTGTNHGVGVYISDDTVFYSYYITGVGDEKLVNNYNSSNRKVKVGTLDLNKYWSTSLVTFMVSGNEYWKLWGTNDNVSFIPLTSPYIHYVNSITQNNYIRTSLTNGEGFIGESFNVYGQHSYILSQLSVYLDNKPIKDVSTNVSFMIPYSFSSIGTHVFSLRIFNNGSWQTVDSVTVSITIKPTGKGEIGEFLPAPYSYIMGAIITIALMILPSIALGKIGISGSESLKYVPIFSGTVGFILSCLIGFFPWYSIFALLFVLILIITVLYLSKNKQ